MTNLRQIGFFGVPERKTPANLLLSDPLRRNVQACVPDSWGGQVSYDEIRGAAWR
jgi:hypothetical protein